MANPDIQLMGATYQAVSGVTLPVAGGGTATFPFVEGSQTITTNNTYDVTSLAQVIVNVAGGGGSGLTYETGTYEPAEDTPRPTISFANSHSTRPFCAIIFDTGDSSTSGSSIMCWTINSYYDYDGSIVKNGTSNIYARAFLLYKTTSSSSAGGNTIVSLTGDTSSDMPYYLTAASFIPYSGSGSRYYRSGRTYKWIAVWKP